MGRLLVCLLVLAAGCKSARNTAPQSAADATASPALESRPSAADAVSGKGACGGICAHGRFPPGSWRPYSKDSAFNRKVPANARLMEKSSLIVERLLGDLAKRKQPANLPLYEDGTSGWPTYWGTAADPLYSIACKWGDCSAAHRKGHAPAGAEIQGGNEVAKDEHHDRHLTFIDQTDGTEFDLWHVATSPLPAGGGTVVADWAGVTRIDGDGRAGCVNEVCKGEGNAGQVGNLAGRVRFEELADAIARRSHVDHALAITIRCTDGTAVYPASTNAGMPCTDPAAHIAKGNRHAPPMGARFRLNLTVARIDAMSRVPEWKKVFLRTLVVYGAIVMDTGTDFYFSWNTESGNQYTSMKVADPWFAFARRMTINAETGKPYTDCWTGPPDTDFQVDCLKSPKGDGYVGVWKNKDDGLDWNEQIWSHLEVLHECVSKGTC